MQTLIYKCNNIFRYCWSYLKSFVVNSISALTLFIWLCIMGVITGIGHTIRLLTDDEYNK